MLAQREEAERQMAIERDKLRRDEELGKFLTLLAEHVTNASVSLKEISSLTHQATLVASKGCDGQRSEMEYAGIDVPR